VKVSRGPYPAQYCFHPFKISNQHTKLYKMSVHPWNSPKKTAIPVVGTRM
jgi:hypothetical protein